MASRPKRGDTEEDLLEFQEKFLAGRNNPSATVVRASKESNDEQEKLPPVQRDVVDLRGLPQSLGTSLGDFGPPKKKSKFKEKRITKMKGKVGSNLVDREEDAAELLERHDKHITTVLSEIRERDVCRSQVSMPNRVLSKGFPEAIHRGHITENGQENIGKRSLFSQHFNSSHPSVFGLPQFDQTFKPPAENHKQATNDNISKKKFPGFPFGSSKLVSGEGLISGSAGDQHSVASREADQIHNENIERLSGLSQQEILQEQERLMKALDPCLLSFLKSRNKARTSENIKASHEQANMEMQLTDLEDKIMIDPSSMEITEQSCESMEVETEDKKFKSKQVQFENSAEATKHDEILKDKVVEVGELTKMAAEQMWVNMDNVEIEKLEWMKDCPAPSAIKKEGDHQARFAFDGNVITRTADVPVNVGLHHHGNEPESAGYTLEELFVLSRSSFLQQRVVALQTLARIIVQDTQGTFTDQLKCSVLSTLLDAGIIFLLRWALDDTADAVIAVAVQCLAAMLIVPSDQQCCDQVSEWYRGHEFPSLRPEVEGKNESESEDENRRNETDAEMVKKDVIKGLLQMRILPRFRYVLEVCRPSPNTVRGIFSILTRIAKHSVESSHAITKCPRMLESIFTKFLPTSWRKIDGLLNDVDDMYGLPAPEALILLRTMCSSGRHLSSLLISKHNLVNHILCYITLHPQDIQLSYEDGMNLCIESIRTWTVCISYGLACDQFRETFPTLLKHIQKLQDISVVKHNIKSQRGIENDCKRACALLKLLEQVVHVAGTSAEMHAKMLASSPNANKEPEADCLPAPPVNWSHVMGFMPLVVFSFHKWKTEIVSLEEKQVGIILDSHVLRSASICNILASFYSKLPAQPAFTPVEYLQDIENLVSTVLIPVINSPFLTHKIKDLGNASTVPRSVLFTRGAANLPDYGTLPVNAGPRTAESMQLFSHGPAVAFMTSLTRLLCSIINCHKGVAVKFLPMVTREEMIAYVQKISSTQEILSQSYFGRFELLMQYFIIKLFYLAARSVDYQDLQGSLPVYHSAALVVFSRLRAGDEYYAHDLMSTVLFNPGFYPEVREQETSNVARDLSVLNITTQGTTSQPLLTKEERPYTHQELICEAHKNLLAIRSTYISSFGEVRHALASSRSLALHQPHDIQSLLLSPSRGPFLPADWMFLPIIDLHNQSISAETKGGGIDEVPPAMISTVTCTLQMILMLEEWRPVSLSSVSMVAKITRLMCIFLTGSDLFLDRFVHHYVSSLLLVYTRPSYLSRLDFNSSVAGLSSFYDLYTSLLSHYSAVSFGDPLFASFLVLPLAQRHDVKFRRALWDEFVGTVRAVSFPVKQVPIPLDQFLYPVEQDDVLLYCYLRALANQDVRPRWCPLFYLLAVHHLNAFIYQRVDPKDNILLKRKLALVNHVMQVKLKEVRDDILYYYKPIPDSSSDKAFEVFSSLPADREVLLRNRQDIEQCRNLYEKMANG